MSVLFDLDFVEISVGFVEIVVGIDVGECVVFVIFVFCENDELYYDEVDWFDGGFVVDGVMMYYGMFVNDGLMEVFVWEFDLLIFSVSGELSFVFGVYWGGVILFLLESGD